MRKAQTEEIPAVWCPSPIGNFGVTSRALGVKV